MIHELKAAIGHVRADRLGASFKILARVKLIQRQLFEQWAVLETLTPSEYEAFRPALAQLVRIPVGAVPRDRVPARQQGCGDARGVPPRSRGAGRARRRCCSAPSLYDEFLRHLARRGLPVPAACLERDFTQPYARHPDLVPVFKTIYDDPARWWDAYDMCEKLVDVEESFQLWRFRHLKTVERIIGHKPGTGGSSGVSFLKAALDIVFFPELIDVRTVIGSDRAG